MKRYVYPCAAVVVTLSVAVGIVLAGEIEGPKVGYALLVAALAASMCVLGYAVGRREDALRETALTDPLTGIGNRRFFDECLARELARAVDSAMPLAVLALDLDDLKQLNDRAGHHTGDRALATLGKVLRDTCRSRDLPARIGGDEFAVIMPRSTAREAAVLGDRVRAELSLRAAGVTVSAGAADLDQVGTRDPRALVRCADGALYAAKASGRDGVAVFGADEPAVRAGSPMRCAEAAETQRCAGGTASARCPDDVNHVAHRAFDLVSHTRTRAAQPHPRSARR